MFTIVYLFPTRNKNGFILVVTLDKGFLGFFSGKEFSTSKFGHRDGPGHGANDKLSPTCTYHLQPCHWLFKTT